MVHGRPGPPNPPEPGAAYDARRAAGDGHDAAPRRVGSKLLGQLHHCLAHRQLYNEQQARPTHDTRRAA